MYSTFPLVIAFSILFIACWWWTLGEEGRQVGGQAGRQVVRQGKYDALQDQITCTTSIFSLIIILSCHAPPITASN